MKNKKQNKFWEWVKEHPIWSLVIFIVLMMFIAFKTIPSDTPESTYLSAGEYGYLYIEDVDYVGVFSTKEDLDEFAKLSSINDKYGVAEMFLDGRGFFVDANTKVLVLESKLFSKRVRILEGEYIGESAWVPQEWVIK